VFTLIQKLLPLLRAGAAQGGKTGVVYNDPARIINIGSVEAIGVPDHDTYAYAAAKAGLHHLSHTSQAALDLRASSAIPLPAAHFKAR